VFDVVRNALGAAVNTVASLPGQAVATAGGLVSEVGTATGLWPQPAPVKDTASQAQQAEPDPKKRVFVVHGRNISAYKALHAYLKALGLTAFNYVDELETVAGAAPFVRDVVVSGLKKAQAIVVLLTPEEHATLLPRWLARRDEIHPANKERLQARPNVIFEAGGARGLHPGRAVLLALGPEVELFSDMLGVHVHRIERDSPAVRKTLAAVLRKAGCDANTEPVEFETAGDFDGVILQGTRGAVDKVGYWLQTRNRPKRNGADKKASPPA
jgi:predicted nucleotide-binding protein